MHGFVTEYLKTHRVSDASYAAALAMLGEHGVVDLVGIAGYYSLLAMMLNTARTAVPEDSDVPPLP